jgi:autotransporter-associated beta strand protein
LLTNLAASSSATEGMNAGSTLGFDTTNADGGTFTIADVIANTTGASGGARNLTKLGTNTLVLSGANTYTGTTTVSGGTLSAGVAAVAGVSGAFGLNNTVNLANVAGVTLDLNGYNTVLGALTGGGTTGGTVALNGGATLTVGTANTNVTFAGNMTGNGNLIKSGTATHSFTGTLSFTGTATASQGILDFANANITSMGGGASSRDITVASVASNAAVRFNNLTNAQLKRIVETTDEITVMTGATTSGAVDFSSSTGANLPNAFLGNWASNGAKAEYNVTITPASDNYRLGGKGSNGLLGIQSVLSGTQGLIVGGTGATGIRVNLVAANTFSGDTVINTGARLTLGNNLALQNSALNVGSAGGNFSLAAGSNAGRIAGETAAASPTFGGLIGSRNLATVFSNSAGNNETNLASTAVTGFTLNPGVGKSHTYTGVIANFATNTTITKTGAGTQTFGGTATHTYSGATTISAGTLEIAGSASINSSAVTINGSTANFRYNSSVAYGGSLAFTNGTISGTNWTGSLSGQTIGTNKTISPGNSPGTATTGSQTWAAGGSYLWEINNATGTAGFDPGWDLEAGTGTLNITAASGSEFNILVTSLTLANAAGLAANFNDALNYNWLIADFADPIGTFAASAFNIDTSDFDNPFTGTFGVSLGTGVLGGDNTQIYLTYTAVPEPRAALLGGLGLLMLLRRRR